MGFWAELRAEEKRSYEEEKARRENDPEPWKWAKFWQAAGLVSFIFVMVVLPIVVIVLALVLIF
jgi:hypothetical protein